MQKLVTIYLDTMDADFKHGFVHEHLKDDLSDGWKIISMTPVGGGGGKTADVAGWLAVVLEK